MIRQLLSFVLFLSTACILQAQDPVFSQFYAAPLQLNPAFAGVTYAPRVTVNYRNQWPGLPNLPVAYETYSASYEQTLEALNSGIGITVLTDNGGNGIYRINQFSAIYGYKVQVANEFAIKIGIEAGILQSTLDWDQLIFSDQLNDLTGPIDPAGNPNLTQELRPDNLTNTQIDVSAGLLAYGGNFYGGVAIKHLNQPEQSFLEINENLDAGLPIRTTVHAGAEISLTSGNNLGGAAFISPNIMYIRQADFTQLNAGAYLGFGRVFAGMWYRVGSSNSDAVIALVGFREGVLRIGYSYDITVSGLGVSPGTGGTHEISLSINFDESEYAKKKRKAARYNDCFKMFN